MDTQTNTVAAAVVKGHRITLYLVHDFDTMLEITMRYGKGILSVKKHVLDSKHTDKILGWKIAVETGQMSFIKIPSDSKFLNESFNSHTRSDVKEFFSLIRKQAKCNLDTYFKQDEEVPHTVKAVHIDFIEGDPDCDAPNVMDFMRGNIAVLCIKHPLTESIIEEGLENNPNLEVSRIEDSPYVWVEALDA